MNELISWMKEYLEGMTLSELISVRRMLHNLVVDIDNRIANQNGTQNWRDL